MFTSSLVTDFFSDQQFVGNLMLRLISSIYPAIYLLATYWWTVINLSALLADSSSTVDQQIFLESCSRIQFTVADITRRAVHRGTICVNYPGSLLDL